MKIIYVSNAALPSQTANSINVMKMCAAMASLGHDVTLVAPDKATDQALRQEHLFDFYNVPANFTVKKLPWVPLPGKGLVYALAAVLWSRGQKADVLYSRNLAASGLAARTGARVICEVHDAIEKKSVLEQGLVKAAYKKADHFKIVAITQALADHLAGYFGNDRHKIIVAADGADPVDSRAVVVPSSLVSDKFKIGYVGSLYKGKGLEIVGALSRLIPQAEFHVVGGTADEVHAAKIKFPDIRFHGFQRQRDIPAFISAFDIVLLPNQAVVEVHGGGGNIARFTSPLKAFEYMACGKAILASDLPALKEIFAHGKNAVLCRPDVIEDWTAAIEHMIAHPDERQRLGMNAKAEFLEHYTWTRRAEHILVQSEAR